jgi:ParB family chromosome partitioning protein
MALNLFGQKEKINEQSKIVYISTGQIKSNPNQPRRIFDEGSLAELSASIKLHGVLQPLTVRRIGNDQEFELIAGERRLRAAQLAELKQVPCIIMTVEEETSAVMALVENLQRENLNCFEEARAISKLMHIFGITQEQLAVRLGKTQPTIANKLRILRLSDEVQKLLMENGFTERHARALLRLHSDKLQLDAAKKIVEKGMNVSQAEQYIESLLDKQSATPPPVRKAVVKDVKIFLNTIDHALKVMRRSGIKATTQTSESEGFIEYTIRIPKAI